MQKGLWAGGQHREPLDLLSTRDSKLRQWPPEQPALLLVCRDCGRLGQGAGPSSHSCRGHKTQTSRRVRRTISSAGRDGLAAPRGLCSLRRALWGDAPARRAPSTGLQTGSPGEPAKSRRLHKETPKPEDLAVACLPSPDTELGLQQREGNGLSAP